jgi:hypothetical protein
LIQHARTLLPQEIQEKNLTRNITGQTAKKALQTPAVSSPDIRGAASKSLIRSILGKSSVKVSGATN